MAEDLPERVEALLTKLFRAADSRDQQAPATFASCFSEQGEFRAGPHALKGRQEIQESRQTSWNGIESRSHTLDGLYKSIKAANQYVLVGRLEILRTGQQEAMRMRFCSKIDIEQINENKISIVCYEAFSEAPSISK